MEFDKTSTNIYKFLDSLGYADQYFNNFYESNIITLSDMNKIHKNLLIYLIPITEHRMKFLHKLLMEYPEQYVNYERSYKRQLEEDFEKEEEEIKLEDYKYQQNTYYKKAKYEESNNNNNIIIKNYILKDKEINNNNNNNNSSSIINYILFIKDYFKFNPFKTENNTLIINHENYYFIFTRHDMKTANYINRIYKLFIELDILCSYKFYCLFLLDLYIENTIDILEILVNTIRKYKELQSCIIVNNEKEDYDNNVLYYIIEIPYINGGGGGGGNNKKFKFFPFVFETITVSYSVYSNEILEIYNSDITKGINNSIILCGDRFINAIVNRIKIVNYINQPIIVSSYNSLDKLINSITITSFNNTIIQTKVNNLLVNSSSSNSSSYKSIDSFHIINYIPFNISVDSDILLNGYKFNNGKYNITVSMDNIIKVNNMDKNSNITNSNDFIFENNSNTSYNVVVKLKYTVIAFIINSKRYLNVLSFG